MDEDNETPDFDPAINAILSRNYDSEPSIAIMPNEAIVAMEFFTDRINVAGIPFESGYNFQFKGLNTSYMNHDVTSASNEIHMAFEHPSDKRNFIRS